MSAGDVSKEEVLRVAKLARIFIPDSEIETVREKFSSLLNHFEFLKEAQTEGVEPLYSAAEKMELRADISEPPIEVEKLLTNAPESYEGSFRLPKVMDQGE